MPKSLFTKRKSLKIHSNKILADHDSNVTVTEINLFDQVE